MSVEFTGTATATTDLLANGAATTFEADNGVDCVADVAFGGNTLDGGNDVTFDAGSGLTITNSTYGSITLTEAAGTAAADYTDAMYAEDGQLSFQVGFSAGDTATTSIGSIKTADLGTTSALSNIDISTVAGAEAALSIIDEAINQVSGVRGDLGAFQVNELEA